MTNVKDFSVIQQEAIFSAMLRLENEISEMEAHKEQVLESKTNSNDEKVFFVQLIKRNQDHFKAFQEMLGVED